MPIVNIQIIEGRDIEKKRALVKNMTTAICESLECPPEKVRIVISEMAPEHYSIAGTLVKDS